MATYTCLMFALIIIIIILFYFIFFFGGGGHFVIHSHLTSLLLTCIRKSENDTKPKSNLLKFQCFI